MSFDLSFLAPAGETVSVQAIGEWLAADDRVAELSGREDSFEAVTSIGGAPWAAFLVEDISDLDPDDRTVEGAPDDIELSGVRVEVSYSTPDPIVHAVFELAAAFAERFALIMVDEQSETVSPVDVDQLRASWTEARTIAHAAFEAHVSGEPGFEPPHAPSSAS